MTPVYLASLMFLLCGSYVTHVLAVDNSIVTEYGYDAEGHIISETRNILTAPPVVKQARSSFLCKGWQREWTIMGSNLHGTAVSTDAAGMDIVLSIPDTTASTGIYVFYSNTASGTTVARVRSAIGTADIDIAMTG